MILPTGVLAEQAFVTVGLDPIVPSSSTPNFVSLKNYQGADIIIQGKNVNSTSVTSGAITLVQATSIAGTTNKTADIDIAWRITSATATNATWESFVPVSDSITPPTTANASWIIAIHVDPSKLDVNGGYDCFRAGVANATGQTVAVTYHLWPARYMGPSMPSPVVD